MNQINKQVDIAIIGGGLVGSMLAILCDKLGLSTALIEQKTLQILQPDNPLDMRHIALSHGSKKILQAIGLWPALKPYTYPITQIHVSDQGRWGFTRLSAKEQQMPALGYVIAYHDLQHILSQQVQKCSYVAYYTDTKLISSQLQQEQWHLALENQQTFPITAKLLIAADGLNSPLRANANIAAIEKDYGQIAIVTTVKVTKPQLTTAYERFTQQGPIALLPAGKDYCALIWTVASEHAEKYLAQTDTQFLQTIQAYFGYRLGKFIAVGQRQSFPLKLVVAQEQHRQRLLLLGSAVHNLHPIAAQGFNLALRDMAGLTDILKQNLADVGQALVLTEYLALRQADQQRTVRFTDGLVLLFSNQFFPLVLLRNSLMVLFDLCPPAKAWLGRYGAGRLGKLSSLARGEPL